MKGAALLRFALRALLRDWRAGELRILAAALIIAVASVSSVGFFTDRVQRAMQQQAGELLAADLVLSSSQAIEATRREQAEAAGLRSAAVSSFRSVVLAGPRTLLVEIKAVEAGYPLRGALRIAPAPFAADAPAAGVPPPGEVWADARLLAQLEVAVGEVLSVGAAELRLGQVITFEPDRAGDLFSIGPRLLMNLADVPATGLIQPGSRADHQLLLAGAAGAVQAYRRNLEASLAPHERVVTVAQARPELEAALARARQFLGLAALVSVLLAGVAIAAATRRFVHRHLDATAIMRCLGADQATVLKVFALEILALALLASALGSLAGLAAQEGLTRVLAGMLVGELPAPGLRPAVVGLLTGLVTLLGFALPPLMALRHVPPARVLRRDLGVRAPQRWLVYGAVVASMAALTLWQLREPQLVAYTLAGALATLLLLALVATALVGALRGLRQRVGVAWRFGLANIARRPRSSVVQVVAFGLGIMVLLLLSIVRADLLEGWRDSLPPDAPNQFLINIQPEQVGPLHGFLAERGVAVPGVYPMVRGRLVAINDVPVSAADYADQRAQRLVTREFNLSWAAQPQAGNRIAAGRWWRPAEHGQAQLSLEQDLARTLGIGLGDRLTYSVGGTPLTVTVTSLRTVQWDSFQVNFFAVVPPGVLEEYPGTWITSFHLPPERRDVLAELLAGFPNVTLIDVEALMSRVRDIIERVALAVQYVFVFTLLAGLVVLYAAIQTHQDERRYESAMLRTLGARRRQLLGGLAAEFITLGLLAGLLAGIAATAVAYALAVQVFGIAFQVNPNVWLVGLFGGALGIGLAGLLGARSALAAPPLVTLRGG